MEDDLEECVEHFCEVCGALLEETHDGWYCPDCQLFVFAIFDEDLMLDT